MVKVITAALAPGWLEAVAEALVGLVKTVTQEQPIMAVMAVLALITLVQLEAVEAVALLGLIMLQALHLVVLAVAVTVERLILFNIVQGQLTLGVAVVLVGVLAVQKMVALAL